MNTFISEKNYYPIDFGNDWGFYIDVENSYSTVNNDKIIREKYNVIFDCDYYYSDIDIDDYEYNNKKVIESKNEKEMETKNEKEMETCCNEKSNSEAVLFHISSVTLITAALTYYVFWII